MNTLWKNSKWVSCNKTHRLRVLMLKFKIIKTKLNLWKKNNKDSKTIDFQIWENKNLTNTKLWSKMDKWSWNLLMKSRLNNWWKNKIFLKKIDSNKKIRRNLLRLISTVMINIKIAIKGLFAVLLILILLDVLIGEMLMELVLIPPSKNKVNVDLVMPLPVFQLWNQELESNLKTSYNHSYQQAEL